MISVMADLFNTREIAIGIWIIIGLILFVTFGKGRKSLHQLVKAAVQRQLIILYFAILIYCSIIVYVLYQWNFWQCSFLKDTIMWIVLSGFGMLIRHEHKNGFRHYLKNYFWDAISVTAIVIFISSAYTFNIWFELISVPVLFMFGGAQIYAESSQQPDHKRVAKFLQGIFVAYGLVAISFSLYGVIGEFREFFTTETLRNFLLPIVLLIAFIPFYYAFTLYSIYEVVFVQLKWPIRNKVSLVKYLKRKLRKYIGVNLLKIERFCDYRHYANPFLRKKDDIDRYFDWLTCNDIGKIIQRHRRLGIDELEWDAIINVILKDGTAVTGEYGDWKNAFHNHPNGEIIYVVNGDEQTELHIDDIVEIEKLSDKN